MRGFSRCGWIILNCECDVTLFLDHTVPRTYEVFLLKKKLCRSRLKCWSSPFLTYFFNVSHVDFFIMLHTERHYLSNDTTQDPAIKSFFLESVLSLLNFGSYGEDAYYAEWERSNHFCWQKLAELCSFKIQKKCWRMRCPSDLCKSVALPSHHFLTKKEEIFHWKVVNGNWVI